MENTTNYKWLNEPSRIFLENEYLLPNQTADERVNLIINQAVEIQNKKALTQTPEQFKKNRDRGARFLENFKRGWYSFSTPIWTNFGTSRGSGISCFGSYIGDTMEQILLTQAEVGMMSKIGGGTSAYFGKLRHRGAPITNNGESSGPASFARLYDNTSSVINQGATRRGSFAGWHDFEHPDIMEWLEFRAEGNPIQDMSFGVMITDESMREIIENKGNARKKMARLIKARQETGMPYIGFKDTINRNTAQVYKDKLMTIFASNLCSEICLPTNELESFVCCLSSMNLLYFDEWKDTDAVELMAWFLDAVLTDFIEKNKDVMFMERAVRFAERHRAIGIGAFGWHSYLQSNMIAYESMEAKMKNVQIFQLIKKQADKANQELAIEYGEPEVLEGYGLRFTTTTAIAPTKSSAFIIGQASECMEPNRNNFHIKDLAKIKFTFKNVYLEKLLDDLGKNTPEVWRSIMMKEGSVQHLDFLTDHQKNVFKTIWEISPKEILIQTAARQKYIDQAQSTNLSIHPLTPPKDVMQLLIFAWEQGVKTLYYQDNKSAAQEMARSIMECTSCEA
jgi:ribonucleoside-diphosphate reductase alpha chain